MAAKRMVRQGCCATRRACGLSLLCASILAAGAWAQETPPEVGGDDLTAALSVGLEIEETLLDQDLEHYERLAGRRERAVNRLVELYRMLDEAVRVQTTNAAERIDLLMQQIELAEGDRTGLLITERVLVDKIRERRERIVMLSGHIQSLASREDETAGPLTGIWDVVMMPLKQRGAFVLDQKGTLVSGTYRLDGGWTGSLQGTLIQNKIRMERIDSQLGRMMEFEGRLSSDGKQLRGNWLNRELAGGDGSSGQWLAQKREPES